MNRVTSTPSVLPGTLSGRFAKHFFLLIFSVFTFTTYLAAQKPKDDIRVKGTVSNKQGEPLHGASIKVKGKNLGSATNARGEFSVAVDAKATLVVSHLGYKRQEVVVAGRTQIAIVLEDSVSNLEDVTVVSVGYGTLRKSDVTGAISKVSLENVNENKVVSVPEALQGRIAGVQIITNTGEPGSGMTFNIRGKTSVTGSNQPLIVIDGQPIESSLGATLAGIALDGGGEIPAADPLATLNPNDIASIEILKDASSIAIYGSRGANGVVLITTKSGQSGKSGNDKVTYATRFDYSMLPKKQKMLSSYDYMLYRNEALKNDGKDTLYTQAQLDSISLEQNTDWQDLVYRKAVSQDHQVSISGRDAKSNYLLSGNYSDQKSIIRLASFKKYGLRMNYQRQISPRLKFAMRNYMSISDRVYGQQSNWTGILGSSVVMGALAFNPLRIPYDADGSIDEDLVNNPLTVLELVKDKTKIRTIISNLNLTYKISNDLSYDLRTGVNDLYSLRNLYYPTGTFIGNTAPNGSATRADNSNTNYLVDNILTYKKIFNRKHSFNAVAGFSYQTWRAGQTSVTNQNFPSNALTYNNMQSAAAPGRTYTVDQRRSLASVISRLNYAYDKRYIVTFTSRYDGATRMADGHKWDFFPSVGLAWNVANEKFFDKRSNLISTLKLRSSYGVAGNENIAIGATQSSYGLNYVVLGTSILPGYIVSNFQNPNLGWEKTKQFNAGIDLGFAKDRFTINIDAYRKVTTDLLINLALPGSAGYSDYYTNVGEVMNKGVDIEAAYQVLKGRVNFDLGANFSIFDNEVIDMGPSGFIYGRTYLAGGDILLGQALQISKPGFPIASFWGYKTDGVYQNQAEVNKGPEASSAKPGDVKWVDLNGDGQITDADKTVIGNPSPDFTYGFNGNLSYKKLTMSFSIFGSQGGQLLNITRWIVGANNTNGNHNLLQSAWDGRWQGEGTSNVLPKVTTNTVRLNQRFPDWMVEDASFVRLQNLNIGYNFQFKRSAINALKLFVSGTNLVTITKYTGYDPNVNAFGHSTLNAGADFGTLPQPRTYSAGVEVTF
jgi:TonB-dependent starch-binding outer membrane protein SusC